MKVFGTLKLHAGILLSIVAVIAFLDFQSWFLEQMHATQRLPIRYLFVFEAVICGTIGILLYRKVRTMMHELQWTHHKLSQREREVLENILSGKSNREIEESLFIEHSTLKSHINRIYKKLGVANRNELMNRYSNH